MREEEGVVKMKLFWFISTSGDSRYLGTEKGKRESYMKQIAQAVEN